MARKTDPKPPETKKERKAAREADSAQPPLIPMSDDEMHKAGKKLAKKVADLEEMELEHDETRKEMRKDEANLKGEIAAIASTITNQGR
jgi:hypothetical protein